MGLPELVSARMKEFAPGPGTAIVAVSGGPDSVALLDLLVATRAAHGLELVVAHVDHGMHPESGRLAEVVRALAAGYELPFELARLALGPGAGETIARARRHAWLEAVRMARGARYVLTAHHADDQAETVLMRALEGTGTAGLAGILPRHGALVRPLLGIRRTELADWLRDRGLTAWEDPANADPRHLRSWLRTEVLTALERRLPDVSTNLCRVAAEAAEDRRAWDAVLELMPGLDWRVEPAGASLAATALGACDPALACALLRAAVRRAGGVLGSRGATRTLHLIRGGRSGARAPLGGGWLAELAFGRLHLLPLPVAAVGSPGRLEGRAGETRWGGWHLSWAREPAPDRQPRDGETAWFVPEVLAVRTWREGDVVRPLRGRGRRLVVRCFQDAQVPRNRRVGWPVLESGGGLVWVPGVCRSELLVPAPGAEALRVDVHFA